jgi:serine/threonine-protein kinase
MSIDDPKRWARVKDIFQAALERRPDERAAYLDHACVADRGLRSEVDSMLRAHVNAAAANFAGQQAVDALVAAHIEAPPSVVIGQQLGHYRIEATIGAGGMGIVYRGRDTKLNRDVALKILPEPFASDPERLARFKREAQVLASLNHSNIAAIYGFEDSGSTHALVLELVEGPTLADRIVKGPVPIDEALPIAKQIAEALDAAHEQGVIHRDLKPANIKVRDDGTVKVLDFGLAKAMEPASAISPALTNSPTLTSPAMMTGVGTLLGTAAYMSPEQAKGRPADKRSDVWAFGCVLYEMLTGTRTFKGDDVAETLAGIIRGEPDWSHLPSNLPFSLVVVIRRCLEKDRSKRISDVRGALNLAEDTRLMTRPTARSMATAPRRAGWYRAAIVVASALALAVAALGGWFSRITTTRISRLTIAPSAADSLAINGQARDVAISPDGTRIVYAGPNGSLLMRSLDQLEPSVLVRGEGATAPFFSPDGRWVGYTVANAAVRKVGAAGGPTALVSRGDGGGFRGASWAEDGTLVFATTNRAAGLYVVRPGLAQVELLTTPDRNKDEGDHLWPEFLPGGRTILFTIVSAAGSETETARVAVLDLATKRYRQVVPSGSHAHYVRSGHLVYAAGNELRAVPFDLNALEARGAPVPVVADVLETSTAAADFDVARDGTLVYVPANAAKGAPQSADRELVWVGRDGKMEQLGAPVRAYLYPRLSPDGTRILLDIRDNDNDIWMWDLRTKILADVTPGPSLDRFPVWEPDGQHFVFTSDHGGKSGVYRQSVDGSGGAKLLTNPSTGVGGSVPPAQAVNAVTPDGKRVIFDHAGELISVLADGSKRAITLVAGSGSQRAALSPDGKWLAYHSADISGRSDVFVTPFSAAGRGREQVSNMGGVEAWWSRKGDELFYFSLDGTLMSVRVGRGEGWSASAPAPVFPPALRSTFFFQPSGSASATFDVSADGQRFLMIRPIRRLDPGPTPAALVVVQNWFEELKQRVPTK